MINNSDEFKKLNRALLLIKEKGFIFKEYSALERGINSNCFKLFDKKNEYFLKFYKNNSNDYRDRLNPEINFLNLLTSNGFKNIPEILYVNKNENFCLFSWIEGKNIKNPKYSDWILYIKFLTDIQALKNSKDIKKISLASEACFFLKDHFALISKRLKKLIDNLSINPKYCDISNWLLKKISKELSYLEFNFINSRNFNKDGNLLFEKLLSPSDVGFHNILSKDNKLYFFDFEYSGWDDPYKLFVDLIIQPENILEKSLAKKILHQFADNISFDIDNEKLILYIQLYKLKWVMIILNKLIYKNINKKEEIKKLFYKVISYHNKVSEIWG